MESKSYTTSCAFFHPFGLPKPLASQNKCTLQNWIYSATTSKLLGEHAEVAIHSVSTIAFQATVPVVSCSLPRQPYMFIGLEPMLTNALQVSTQVYNM